jgi:tetratricopeptide (TPR) repeat protein
MKRLPHPPVWLPGLLHLAHGLIAGGAGFMLASAATIWGATEPGSMRATMALVGAIGLVIFEVAFLFYWIARRWRIRRLWRDAARFLKLEQYEAAQQRLLELAGYAEYRIAPQPVLFALGAANEGMGNERDALILYRRCGDFPPALRAVGMLQLQRGLNDSAADALRRLVARFPQDSMAMVLLALALFRGGHQGAAQKVLQRGLEKRPKSNMLRVNLARVEKGDEPSFDLAESGE